VASRSCAQDEPIAAQDSCNGIHIIKTISSHERIVRLYALGLHTAVKHSEPPRVLS